MFKDVKDMNKELKDALQKHYELCYCYGCKNNPERCHCAFKSFYDGDAQNDLGLALDQLV